MKEVRMDYAGKGKWNIIEAGVAIGNLSYKRSLSVKADIMLKGVVYEIRPRGWWGTTMELRKDDMVLATLRMGWRGMEIKCSVSSYGVEYILQHKGFLKERYLLSVKGDPQQLEIEPSFKWSQFAYDFKINAVPGFKTPLPDGLLAAVAAYCIHYYVFVISFILGLVTALVVSR